MYSAIAIANYFIQNALEKGVGLTNLRLQKTLWFAHATFYHDKGRRLFDDPVVAWPLGPVVPSVYYLARPYGARPISDLLTAFDLENGVHIPLVKQDDAEVNSHLADISRILQGVETSRLVALSHRPDGAWYKTLTDVGIDPKAGNLADIIPRNLTILDKTIQELGK